MLEFGSFVQEARAPVASAMPPPSMFAVPLSVQAAVALLFQRQRLLLMFPHRGLGARDIDSACRTGSSLPRGELVTARDGAPRLRKIRKRCRSLGFPVLSLARTSTPGWLPIPRSGIAKRLPP